MAATNQFPTPTENRGQADLEEQLSLNNTGVTPPAEGQEAPDDGEMFVVSKDAPSAPSLQNIEGEEEESGYKTKYPEREWSKEDVTDVVDGAPPTFSKLNLPVNKSEWPEYYKSGKQYEEFNPDGILIKEIEGIQFKDATVISDQEKLTARENIESMGTWEVGLFGYNVDTGIELSPNVMASLVGMGETVQSSINGFKQMLGIDEEKMQEESRFVRALGETEEYGFEVGAGQVVGYVIEPVGYMVPGIKGAKLSTLAMKGAAAGGFLGWSDYVDEETGESRITNTGLGVALGGALGYGVGKVMRKSLSKKVDAILPDENIQTGNLNPKLMKENTTLLAYEEEGARLINSGKTEKEAIKILRKKHPELTRDAERIMEDTTNLVDFKSRAKNLALESEVLRTGDSADVISAELNRLRDKEGLVPAGRVKKSSSTFDEAIGLIGSRVRAISPQYHHRMMKQQTVLHTYPEKLKKHTLNFEKFFPSKTERTTGLNTLLKERDFFSETQVETLKKYVLNGQFEDARSFIKTTKGDEALSAFEEVISMFRSEGIALKNEGILSETIDNYFPRFVMPDKRDDYLRAVKKYLERTNKGAAKKFKTNDIIERYNKYLDGVKARYTDQGRQLSAFEESNIFRKWFLSDSSYKVINPSKAKRGFQEIPDELLQYYADPIAATHNWIHRMAREKSLIALLGDSAYQAGSKTSKMTKAALKSGKKIDASQSIVWDSTAAVDRFFNDDALGIFAKLDPDGRRELQHLTKVVMGQSMTDPSNAVRVYKSLVSSFFIGNPFTAFLQLGDLAASSYAYGVKNAMKGMALALKRDAKSKVSMLEMGLERHSQEFEDILDAGKWYSKLANTTFKYSGFNALDKLGKETLLNSALVSRTEAVKDITSSAFRKFRRKYENAWGVDGFDDLVKELRKIDISKGVEVDKLPDSVQTMLLTEISGYQPVTILEAAEWSKTNKFGRAFGTLKSFMFKQLDIMRRDMWDEAVLALQQKDMAHFGRAIKNLTSFVATIGLGNLTIHETREILKGNTPFADYIDSTGSDRMTWMVMAPFFHSFKLISLDEHLIKNLQQNGAFGGTMRTFAPPVPVLDNVLRESAKKDPEWFNSLMYSMPFFGAAARAGTKQRENPYSIVNTVKDSL